MLTTHATEKKANSIWKLHPAYSGSALHEQLAANEYKTVEELARQRSRALRSLLEYCYDLVPYYKEVFERLKIRRRHLREPGILQEIPILEKAMVAANADKLRPLYTAPDQRVTKTTRTSGTTGQPTIIHHDKRSMGMFPWLKQRELRWFRYDPMGTLLSIRPDVEQARAPDGDLLKKREILKLDSWPYTAELFQTGRSWGFINTNTIQDQVELLNKLKPNYLIMQSSGLEFISLQEISGEAKNNLRAVQGISNTLTPNMRAQVENALNVPVHQDYGLNEIGLVAARCPEGGRYHVHEEHCLVEIVDERSLKCVPGSTGRLVVTSLSNYAMPLLRYDADDLAEAVEGNCVCGRTLASFGAVHGRYRRTAFLPEGTFQRWAELQAAMYELAKNNLATVRKYQAYQDLTGAMELRIDCDEDIFIALRESCLQAYARAYKSNAAPPISVVRSKQFRGEMERKFQNFISEFTPESDL
ncbi:MAG: hypothetical protein COB20_12860 [SAR86 cluster bacterium]|uniref:AMP-dependent synthetase/ligase domain-containing protein n=1 Tax=SAR86 cluster bacterium TaxID=2030880 RepID=A0A2A4WYD7_9GAMM|nr:MAG: hypothetical protein COB20_12860 [SAR86 cluster bacterium]